MFDYPHSPPQILGDNKHSWQNTTVSQRWDNSNLYLIVAEIQNLQSSSQTNVTNPVPPSILSWDFTKFIVRNKQTFERRKHSELLWQECQVVVAEI